MKILIIGAYPESIINFRGHLIKLFVNIGHSVTIMTAPAPQKTIKEVEALGAIFRPYDVQRNGLNPIADLRTCLQLKRAIKEISPDKILAYTIKPIIWGSIAARLVNQPGFIAMITGLGYAFETRGLKRRVINRVVKSLYQISLSTAESVIFQNNDNLNVFVDQDIVAKEKCHKVNGSGINVSEFQQYPLLNKVPTFLLIARLLGDKGIREYVEAAKKVKIKYPTVKFQLLGPLDSSPDGIAMSEISMWHDCGFIDYLGETTNVIPFIQQCHIYTLPSYHEGLPRTVLEAMAIGRPILTTDTSGCRDTVIGGRNGVLIPIRNIEILAEKIIWFIENQSEWKAMADASRSIACELFDVHKVNQAIIRIMNL